MYVSKKGLTGRPCVASTVHLSNSGEGLLAQHIACDGRMNYSADCGQSIDCCRYQDVEKVGAITKNIRMVLESNHGVDQRLPLGTCLTVGHPSACPKPCQPTHTGLAGSNWTPSSGWATMHTLLNYKLAQQWLKLDEGRMKHL